MASGASGLRPLTWQSRPSQSTETGSARSTRYVYPTSDSASGSRTQQAQPRQRRDSSSAQRSLRDNQNGEEPSSRGRESRYVEDEDRAHRVQEGQSESAVKQNGVPEKKQIVIKIGILGESQSGKSSLLVSYVDGKHSDAYCPTLGINCTEKTLEMPDFSLNLSLWELGGHRQFLPMLPLVCNEADAILFVFDLTLRSSLQSIRQSYIQARQINKAALVFLVGTKYDELVKLPADVQNAINEQTMSFTKVLKTPLFYTSVTYEINVHKLFKAIIAHLFDIPCPIPKNVKLGEPIVLY